MAEREISGGWRRIETEDQILRVALAIVKFQAESKYWPARIGGFDYDGRLVIRDHAAERKENRTVILWEGRDHAEYRRVYAMEEAKILACAIAAELDRTPPDASETEGAA